MLSNRTTRSLLLASLITCLVLGAYAVGVGTTWFILESRSATPEEAEGFGLFWEAWRLVEDQFLGELPDTQHLAWGAIRGALQTLDDDHTTFLEPQPRQREKEDLSGQFGGIGAYVTQDEEGRILLDPMPDLPAEQAGVETGDAVIQVDDTPVTPEMSVDEVVILIRGKVGTIVRLTLERGGLDRPLVVEVERQTIPTPSVEWRILEDAEDIGYVRIALFSGRTGTELGDALDELEELGIKGLVLDLRGNGGGLLGAAVDVANEFLSEGVILYQVEKDDREEAQTAKRGGRYDEGPLTLLVDGGTASASEIVAGALQDTGRAVLIGEKTYGKGSVQSVFDLSDGSSVHITSAEWLTPNRHEISGQGLIPDYEVSISEEERSQGLDPQLERAVEYLLGVR